MSRLPIAPLLATVVPQKQSIAVEEMGNYLLTVHNQGRQKVCLIVNLEGVNKHWVMISPRHLTLQAGDSAKVVVTITPPRMESCRAGDYQLRFILREPSTYGPTWHDILEADLSIEPFAATPPGHLAHNTHKANTAYPLGKTFPFQTLLLLTLLLLSCILIWLPFRAWPMASQEFKDSFRWALLEPTYQASEDSRRSLTEPLLPPTLEASAAQVFIAPNWSAPLSSPTPLPTITFIPTATATATSTRPPTATSTRPPTASPLPQAYPLPTATFMETALPLLDAEVEVPQALSPTVPLPAPTAVSTTSPTESPTTIATTTPPESDSRLFASSPTSLMIEPATTSLTYEEMFRQIGAQYAIDWRLLASVAYQESSLNPEAVGKDGEMGLMQILPTTWDEFAPEVGVSEPFEPYSNVQVGAAYLNYLRGYLVSQGYSEEYWTLVAYNWGPQNMRELMQQAGNWGDVPPSRQNYAYQIIETVNNYNNPWFESKLKEYISGTTE